MSPIVIGIIVLATLILLPMAVKILAEHERGVIFRLGRLVGVYGPGLFLIIPFIDRVVKVDLRVVEMDLLPQTLVTQDNVEHQVGAAIYFRVVDPEAAVVKVLDHIRATSQISQDVFRKLLINSEHGELANYDNMSKTMQESINKETRQWGVEISEVNIKEILENYGCNICRKEVVVTKAGDGTLICCGREMRKIK